MKWHSIQIRFRDLLLVIMWLVTACGGAQPAPSEVTAAPLSAGALQTMAAPTLPFPDNPDPNECGIPTRWGLDDPAWLSGEYNNELVQPVVLLYDSHSRNSVIGAAPHGAEVRIKLAQSNPTLNFYLVETVNVEPRQAGWVPAPFLELESPPVES
ncbi:MAG: hypothetical protein GFH24_608346n41 [Chloroflexi bacterium AL-N5]|nr:hypothetical protein [Chloroflexi bacterium AL-N5]